MSFTPAAVTGVGCIVVLVGSSLSFVGSNTRIDADLHAGRHSLSVSANQTAISAFDAAENQLTTGENAAEQTLRQKLELLERGRSFIQNAPGYTAQFRRQEVVQGELLEEQSIFLKCRHHPFSVYLLWVTGDVGQEVLYIDGVNNGKLLAHDGGWKARLPAFWLSPHGSLAMRDSRYPVTSAGILGLIDIMAKNHRHDLEHATFAACELSTSAHVDGRPCFEFTTRYKSHAASPQYRKSVTRIDQEWNIPLETRHFEWPSDRLAVLEQELDDATLVEAYYFTELDFDYRPCEIDFDRSNPDYKFR